MMAHVTERKPYHDPDAPSSEESRAIERKNRWYYAKQNIYGTCVICTFPVMDSRRDITGQLKCKSHFA